MDIDRYRQQHNEILDHVSALRALIGQGIENRADDIAQLLMTMSSNIKFHLAAEDSVLYPALRASSNPEVAELGHRFQTEMTDIAGAYGAFIAKWRVGAQIASAPEAFRSEANAVFRALHERIRCENQELYPAAERVLGAGSRSATRHPA